jgi:hypothetical protein
MLPQSCSKFDAVSSLHAVRLSSSSFKFVKLLTILERLIMLLVDTAALCLLKSERLRLMLSSSERP